MSLINDYLKRMEKDAPPEAAGGTDVPPSLLRPGSPRLVRVIVVLAIVIPAFCLVGLIIRYHSEIEAVFTPIADETPLKKSADKSAQSIPGKKSSRIVDAEKPQPAGKIGEPSSPAAQEQPPLKAPQPSDAAEPKKSATLPPVQPLSPSQEEKDRGTVSMVRDSPIQQSEGSAGKEEKPHAGGRTAQNEPASGASGSLASSPSLKGLREQGQATAPAQASDRVTLAPPNQKLNLPGWKYPANAPGAPPTPPVEGRDGAETHVHECYTSGVTAQKSGDLAEAERQYLKALKRRKDHSETITNLSAVYIKQNKYAEAEEILKRLDKSSPTNAKALVNLGTIHLHRKQYEKAKDLFHGALAINPGEEAALMNLAYIAQQENDPIAREIYYQKVLDLFPDNQDILFAYASFCETKHRYGDALGYYRRGLALERVRSDARLRQIVSNRVQLLESMVSGKSTVNSGK